MLTQQLDAASAVKLILRGFIKTTLDRSTQKNQRLYERYDCVYPIDLYYKHTLLGNGLIENISPEGLLLSIAEHNLHSDSVVEISFPSLNDSALINPTPYNSSLHNNEKIIVPHLLFTANQRVLVCGLTMKIVF
jgi:hypothetical protein